MKLLLTLSLTLISLTSTGQTSEIVGKVLCSDFPNKDNITEHEFWNASEAIIFGNDSIRLGTTDETGAFRLHIPQDIQTLTFGWIGMYPDKINLTTDCDFLEIILLPDVIYDFVSYKKEQKLRKKDREVLPELYRMAYEQGIFKKEKPCR